MHINKKMLYIFTLIITIGAVISGYIILNSHLPNKVNTELMLISSNEENESYKDYSIEENVINWNIPVDYIAINDLVANLQYKKDASSPICINNNYSIYCDYEYNHRPDLIQIILESDKDDLYFWDYEIKNDKSLNFSLPDLSQSKSKNFFIKVNLLWTKNNITYGEKQYEFNINMNCDDIS